jgi:hypothetical protein
MTKATKAEQASALEALRKLVKPGDTVHTTLEHVSRSGMSRRISLYRLHENEADWLTGYVCTALGYKRSSASRDTLVVSGCGMDMGFHIVYALSRALYPDGFGCIGERCPSNDHRNGDRDYTAHHEPGAAVRLQNAGYYGHADHWHTDGGYALQHRWL